MYAGLLPAVIANLPVMLSDYAIFKRVRAAYEQNHPNYLAEARSIAGTIAAASAFSKVVGTAMGEPFSILSKKVAVDAIKAQAKGQISVSVSAAQTALTIAQMGITEFWSGFPKKSISTGVSAVVSKQAQHSMKRMSSKKFMAVPVAKEATGEKRRENNRISSFVLDFRMREPIASYSSSLVFI